MTIHEALDQLRGIVKAQQAVNERRFWLYQELHALERQPDYDEPQVNRETAAAIMAEATALGAELRDLLTVAVKDWFPAGQEEAHSLTRLARGVVESTVTATHATTA